MNALDRWMADDFYAKASGVRLAGRRLADDSRVGATPSRPAACIGGAVFYSIFRHELATKF